VQDHAVKWDARFEFECKMNANASNGVLNSCLLRISVRKEAQGGRSSVKLGFVDLDLAEFAGAGLTNKRCLLEAYSNTHHRSDNSTLKVSIEMTLLHGDPLFKRPSRASSSFYAPLPTQGTSATVPSDPTTPLDESHPQSLSGSSTKESITDGVIVEDGVMLPPPATLHNSAKAVPPPPNQYDIGHSRNSSQQSKASFGSGYGSLSTHSRQGSSEVENRVDATRVNPEDIIQELVATNLTQTALAEDESHDDDVGLEIYVGRDGTATLGSRSGTNERRRRPVPAGLVESGVH